MTVRLPSKVDGPIVVVVDRDGERVALRMDAAPWPSEGKTVWCPDPMMVTHLGFNIVFEPIINQTAPRHTVAERDILDWWPADGVALPESVVGDIVVCYADGADRRVVLLRSDDGAMWSADGITVARFGDSRVDTEPGGLCAVLGWAYAGPAALTPSRLAAMWRVDPAAIREALHDPY